MIQIWTENDKDFKEVASRESGLIKTKAYAQLIEVFFKVLRLLEKYVVDITWVLEKGKVDTDSLKYINTTDGKEKIISMLSTLTKSKNLKLLEFNKDFLDTLNQRLEEQNTEILNKIQSLANKQGDIDFSAKIDEIKIKVAQLTKDKHLAEAIAADADEARAEAEVKAQQIQAEKDAALVAYENERRRRAFQGALIGNDKERIIGLQHQIYHSSGRINTNIKLILKKLPPESLDAKVKKY